MHLRRTTGTFVATVALAFALAAIVRVSVLPLAAVRLETTPLPQYEILDPCKGSVSWEPVWGSYFMDASRNCDNDLTRAGVNGPDGVDAMDFDGDCDLDVVTGWEENGRVFVYLNPRLRERPVAAGAACPKTYPAATAENPVFQQWPFTEITREDTSDARPFRGVEDARFVDNNSDTVADYVVISTEIGSNSDGRREIFVSVPSDGATGWKWRTFKLTGEENYMRSVVGDLDGDGCPDIVAGSKSGNGRSGDIRWWRCPGRGRWKPETWKLGTQAGMPSYQTLHDDWGTHHLISGAIYWVMEMVVVDFETTPQADGRNYPELLFTDRDTLGYFRLKNRALIDKPEGWEEVIIDEPGDTPFRWLDVGQLVKNGPNGSDGPPEIVVAYNDPAISDKFDRGVFARWYEQVNGVWQMSEVVLDGGRLPWPYEKDNTNKAAAFADLDGDGQNEIVGAIRGIDYSAVFYLAPRPGRTAADQRCNGSACDAPRQWVIQRISPHFTGGEVKADNLVLADLDLDCDIDVASVDENFGANQRGLGVSWYANTVSQRGFPCNRAPAFEAPDLSTLVLDEGTPYARDFVVRDSDDPASALTVTLAAGSPGEVVPKDRAQGVWTWRDTPIDGLSAAARPRLQVTLVVVDGWANGTATATFDYYQANVAPTITSLSVDPSSTIVGQAVTVRAGSSDPAGAADTYTCHISFGDGSSADVAAPGGSCSTLRAYATPGTFTIEATVSDEDGGTSQTLSGTVAVLNPAPVVSAPTLTPVVPGPLREGGALTAAAAFTDEAPAGPYTCSVDFGDGTTATGVLSAGGCSAGPHAYADDGTFAVTVRIADKYGVTGEATATFAVANVVPAVTAVGTSITENGTATIGGTITDPGGLDAFTVVVAWGNGRTTAAVYNAGTTTWSASMQYVDDDPTGTPIDVYPVSVSVLDDGSVPGLAATAVTVANAAPSVSIDSALDEFGNQVGGVGVVLEHTAVTLTASFADVGTLDTHAASVAWGDGTAEAMAITSQAMSGSHTFSTPGTRVVALTVTDDDTGATTATVRIEVVDASGAIAHLVAVLHDRLDDPATSPEMIIGIRGVLAELEGQQAGRGGGAFDLLARGAWTAALVKLRNAVVELDALGLDAESTLVVLAARSLMVDLIEEAVQHPAAAEEAAAMIRAIDPTSPRPEQIDACQAALVVLRPALR